MLGIDTKLQLIEKNKTRQEFVNKIVKFTIVTCPKTLKKKNFHFYENIELVMSGIPTKFSSGDESRKAWEEESPQINWKLNLQCVKSLVDFDSWNMEALALLQKH